jgi:hypothetical protein
VTRYHFHIDAQDWRLEAEELRYLVHQEKNRYHFHIAVKHGLPEA